MYEVNFISIFFVVCKFDELCIIFGIYVFLGVVVVFSGIMYIIIFVVVIMFEFIGVLIYILLIMIVVGVMKVVSEFFGKGGIVD